MSGNAVAPSIISRTMSAWPVARGLLDEVQQHPAHRPRVDVVGEPRHSLRNRHRLAQIGDARDRGLGLLRDLVVKAEDVGERLVRTEAEVRLVVIAEIVLRRALALQHDVDPPPLDRGHVLDEAADAQGSGGGSQPRLLVGEPVGGDADDVRCCAR